MNENNISRTDKPETRRDFLRKTAGAMVTAATFSSVKVPVHGQSQAPAPGRVTGDNDRIVIGFIGVGRMGMEHVRTIKAHVSANNVVMAGVCDVWSKRVESAKGFVGTDCQGFEDYRRLLERKDIDAVVVATVDHWHGRIAVDAMNAGKHVYVEKPLTRYFGEAFEVYDTAKRTGKIVQVGTQACSAVGWHKAAEMIRAGKLGPLVWAQGYYCRNVPNGEWNYPIEPDARPDNLNWDLWLGPVKKLVPFSTDHYFRWRKYYPYSAGVVADLLSHRLHPLMLATGKPEFPTRVVCLGTHKIMTDRKVPGTADRDVPEHTQVMAEFPSGLCAVLVASTVNEKSPGCMIYGHHATLNLGNLGEAVELTPERPFAEQVEPESYRGLGPTIDTAAHETNWLDCIRTGKAPNAGIELSVRAQTVITLAEMAERLNITCLFDEKTRQIRTGDGNEIKPITYGTLDV